MKMYISTVMIFLFCLAVLGGSGDGFAQTGNYTSASGEEAWTDDMDEKLDKTIRVLSVIKEELEDYKKTEAETAKAPVPGQKAADAETAWSRKLAAWLGRAIRTWKKIRKETASETGTPSSAELSEEEAQLTRDISGRLDQAIKAMTAIKEELDKEEGAGAQGRK
jgi:hypothetical protein